MSILDIIILIIILFSGILGFKRGVFKELVLFIGLIMVFIISYKLKNYLGDFLVLNFPFFSFPNIFSGLDSLNIILYQTIAFVIIGLLLYTIYELIVAITGIFEKILKFTIILGIPSKILGFIVGLIKGYIIAYVVLFFLSQPIFKLNFIDDNNLANRILKDAPILNKITGDTLQIIEEVYNVSGVDDKNEINLKIIDLILKNKVTDVEVIEKLIAKDKLKVENIDSVIIKYKGE